MTQCIGCNLLPSFSYIKQVIEEWMLNIHRKIGTLRDSYTKSIYGLVFWNW